MNESALAEPCGGVARLSTVEEATEALALALTEPYLADVAAWFATAHPALLKQGLAR